MARTSTPPKPSPAERRRRGPISSTVARERARVGSLSRSRKETDPELLDARRALRAEVLAEHIAREVERAPRLTDAQCSRLRDLLSSPAGTDQ